MRIMDHSFRRGARASGSDGTAWTGRRGRPAVEGRRGGVGSCLARWVWAGLTFCLGALGPGSSGAPVDGEAPGSGRGTSEATAVAAAPLELREVLDSVATQYPPYLAALIERDIAEGRLRSASGVYDPGAFARLFGTPGGYYESATVEAGVEQFVGLWGASVFGGYRYTGGDLLPDYYSQRTQGGGEARFGLRLPLLQDGSIDSRRAGLLRSRLERELAEPSIRRQHLDFGRAAMIAYYQWAGAGRRWEVSEEILRVARDRQQAIERQIEQGLAAPIVSRENRQLVVSRELGVVRARRRFEASALAMSLLLRNAQDRPIVAGRDRLPPRLPMPEAVAPEPEGGELHAALNRRPEIRQLELTKERLEVDLRVARNSMLPRLDASAEAIRSFGEERYTDREETEMKVGVEFRMPLRRSQARGALQETQGRLEQLDRQLGFARDRIVAEIRNAHQALVAALEQVDRASLNVRLAGELQDVERERFERGAADLLALQIREQAAFQARIDELEALEQSFVARADLLTALALDPRPAPVTQTAPPAAP